MDLFWVEDLLPKDFLKKRMFGGYAYYIEEKLILLLFESYGNRQYRGKKYDFEIWNGCMFPVEKQNQLEVLKHYPFLIPHPVLPKWLYLPFETEDFESLAESLLRELRRRNPLFGTLPKPKKSKLGFKKKSDEDEIIDTRRPRMFSEDSAEEVLQKARKITDLKNLGPESEKAFAKAGIHSAPQLIKMGWQKAMKQMCESDPKNNHSIFAYAVIGALQNKMWNLISDEDKKEARELMKSLREKPASESRKSQKTRQTLKKKATRKKVSKRKPRPSTSRRSTLRRALK